MAEEIKLEKKLKHLDFIQLIITRMNVNSFLVKGWSVTLVSVLVAFAEKDTNPKYCLIVFIPLPIFLFLDAYYLSLERQYRALYNLIRQKDENQIDFDLNASCYNDGDRTTLNCLKSPSISLFYGGLIVVTLIVMFFIQ